MFIVIMKVKQFKRSAALATTTTKDTHVDAADGSWQKAEG